MKRTIGMHAFWPALGLLCAGAVAEAAQPVKLTFAYPWLGDATRGGITRQLVADYEKLHPNVQIELIQPTGNADNWLAVRVAAGTQPNLWVNGPEYVPRFAQHLVDIGQVLKNDGRYNQVVADLVPGARDLISVDGKMLGMPINTQLTHVTYLNAKLLGEQGVAAPQEGWNWDDLLALGRKLGRMDADKPVQWGLGTLLPYYWWMYALTLQNGAPDYSADGRTFLPNPEGSTEALAYLDDLIYSHEKSVFPNQNALNLFEQGKVGIYFDGSYRLPALLASGVDLQVGPILHGPVRAATHGVNHVLIAFQSGNAATDQAAAKFIAWFADAAQAARYDAAWGDLAARQSTFNNPNYASMLSGERGAAIQGMIKYLPYYWPQVTPVTLFADWGKLITQALDEHTPPKSAIATMKETLQPRFDDYAAND